MNQVVLVAMWVFIDGVAICLKGEKRKNVYLGLNLLAIIGLILTR